VVIVETTSIVEAGDIVVAAVNGQLTVKYLCKAKDCAYYLEPANAAYEASTRGRRSTSWA